MHRRHLREDQRNMTTGRLEKLTACVECHKLKSYHDSWIEVGESVYQMFSEANRLKEGYCPRCEHKTVGMEVYRK